jgi:hypothetical protein
MTDKTVSVSQPENLRERLKALPRFPYHTWDGGKSTKEYQELIGLEDVMAELDPISVPTESRPTMTAREFHRNHCGIAIPLYAMISDVGPSAPTAEAIMDAVYRFAEAYAASSSLLPVRPIFCTRGPHEIQQVCPDAFGVPCSEPDYVGCDGTGRMVEAALDKYLPSGYAMGDEATAELALKLALIEQDLFKLRQSLPERSEICEVCGENIGPICTRIVWWDENVKQHQRHAIDCLAKPENVLASLPVGESTRDLHLIICQAVALLNQGDTLKAHTLLREALAEYVA